MNNKRIMIYVNSIIMFVGVISYLIVGLWMQSNFILINESITRLFILGLGLLMITLAFGLFLGAFIAVFQFSYGIYLMKTTSNNLFKDHFISCFLWLILLVIFIIGVSSGIIVTV